MKTTLDTLRPGQSAIVTAIHVEPESAERLMELGLLEGTPIQLLKFAPLGDPLEILVRGYHLSLRKYEAQHIEIETEGEIQAA